MSRTCTYCGASPLAEASFCHRCGRPLTRQQLQEVKPGGGLARAGGLGSPGEGPAQRRQLTVLFCDIVRSTALSERLDPEKLREIVCAYHQVCSSVVAQNDGYIAQYLGDGVLIYFGYPVAQEDAARRAVRSALAILTGVRGLSEKLRQESGPELAVRMCIHTGQVVVGEVGGGAWRAQLALGEAPNLAGKVQSLAEPNTVLITAATHQLVQPFFSCEDLGPHTVQGLTRSVRLFRVVGETGRHAGTKADATFKRNPLVGRKTGGRFLWESWERAKTGSGQSVLISGQPGIGKSRSVEELKMHLRGERCCLLECYCSPYQQSTAFAPISDLLGRMLGVAQGSPQDKLSKLAAAMEGSGFAPKSVVPLLAPLLSVPLAPEDSDYPALDLTPLRRRQQTMETLLSWLSGHAKEGPVLFVVEDLHWADRSTLELLRLVMNEQRVRRMLTLLTFRSDLSIEELAKLRDKYGVGDSEGGDIILPRLVPKDAATLATHVARHRTLRAEVLIEAGKRTEDVSMFVEDFSEVLLGSESLMVLTGLYPEEVTALATHVADNRTLPAEVLHEVVERTDGVPLFVEELTKMFLESEFLKKTNGSYELTGPLPREIPSTVQDSLMARLDRLGSATRTLAQLGATLGRTFRHDVLHAVAAMDEEELLRALGRLLDADLVTRNGLPPEATYSFRHALIAETAYQSLLKSTQKLYHQRIAETLVDRFPRIAETEPERLAQHFTEAGFNREAIAYWEKAGQRAMERSANAEAIHRFRRGLDLLAGLPEAPERVQQELRLHLCLGLPLMATKGYAAADVGATFARARQLCAVIGALPQLAPALYGLWGYNIARCEWEVTREIADQLLAIAEQQQDTDLLLEAYTAKGTTDRFSGPRLSDAQQYLEKALSLYDPKAHKSHALIYSQDPGVVSLANLTHVLWFRGYPGRAFEKVKELEELAETCGHAYSRAYSFAWEATLSLWSRCAQRAGEVAEKGIDFVREKGFLLWEPVLTQVRCWVQVQQEKDQARREEAVKQSLQALENWRATGALVNQPCMFGILADTYRHVNQVEKALDAVNTGLKMAEDYRERWYEPELHRLKGDLLLMRATADEEAAEVSLRKSLQIAGEQGAASWELRTSMSLARLWQRQDKRDEAHRLLGDCYASFSEGFETPDLKEARELLDRLQ